MRKNQEKTLKHSEQFDGLKRFPKGVRVEVWTTPDNRNAPDKDYTFLRIVAPGFHLTTGLPFDEKDPMLIEEVTDVFGALVDDNPRTVAEFLALIKRFSG